MVRTLGDHACHELCLSAPAEALVTVSDGARADQTVGGVALLGLDLFLETNLSLAFLDRQVKLEW